MTLQNLELRNFQNHKKLSLEFDPGANSIVGASDVGKSAIIRALQWVAYNKPSGDAFIRHGQTKCRVRLGVDDRYITRYRDNTTNSYEISGEDKLVSFGTKVPKPVQELLNIGPINLQQQHDPPFWFSAPASEVSRSLNAIVDLGGIDESLGWLSKNLNARASDSAYATATLNESQLVVDKQPDRQAIEAGLAALERLEEKLIDSTNDANMLSGILSRVQRETERKAQATSKAETLAEVLEAWKQLDEAKKNETNIKTLIDSAHSHQASLSALNLESIDELESLMDEAFKASQTTKNLREVYVACDMAAMDLKAKRERVEVVAASLADEEALWKEERERENRKCQTCGQDLPF